jgi:signal transduction histidine kinase
MRWRGSLLVRLSLRLILLQVLALTLAVIVASIPEPDKRGVPGLDEDVLFAIADSLVVQGDRLVVPDLNRVYEVELDDEQVWDYPDFWFIAADALGRRMEHGPVPERVRALLDDAYSVIFAEVYRGDGGPRSDLIARRIDGPAGRFTIASGGGPSLETVIVRLQRIDPRNLAFVIVVMIGSALIIPWMLRRDLAGVARVAEEASLIDINQPGTRLTAANVPLELQGMVGAMNAALARLDEGLEKRRRFLATAAHELRTPVAILSMRIEMLPPGPASRQLMLDVARLAALSDHLLDLERLDSEGRRFTRLDLGALVAEAVTDIAPLAVASEADLSFDRPPGPVEAFVDGQAIQRVVTNLVQNAIAHGGPGVAIVVEVARPSEIRVRDNGPGIATADRLQIFEPFFRRSGTPGSGLGLHLVQEIVARHGGTIQVNDAPGGGAEFVIRLSPEAGGHAADLLDESTQGRDPTALPSLLAGRGGNERQKGTPPPR